MGMPSSRDLSGPWWPVPSTLRGWIDSGIRLSPQQYIAMHSTRSWVLDAMATRVQGIPFTRCSGLRRPLLIILIPHWPFPRGLRKSPEEGVKTSLSLVRPTLALALWCTEIQPSCQLAPFNGDITDAAFT